MGSHPVDDYAYIYRYVMSSIGMNYRQYYM